jgi:hypothetical protein
VIEVNRTNVSRAATRAMIGRGGMRLSIGRAAVGREG